jgi:hypothetical protein
MMNERLFDSPVFVKDGTFIVREIACLDEALEFLDEWPEAHRDLIYQITWKACCDAFDGHKPLYVARDAFEGFARRAEILEDPASVMPWINAAKTRGRVPT